jgi:hypothetical protein
MMMIINGICKMCIQLVDTFSSGQQSRVSYEHDMIKRV